MLLQVSNFSCRDRVQEMRQTYLRACRNRKIRVNNQPPALKGFQIRGSKDGKKRCAEEVVGKEPRGADTALSRDPEEA